VDKSAALSFVGTWYLFYFIHQTPKVAYTGIKKTSIEFGDILYLYTETDNKNYKKETALLLQTKVYSDSKVDSDQLTFYTDWPTFWFYSKDVHTARFNVESIPQPHPGGRYLFLDDSNKNLEFASTGTPKPGMKANQFDDYLENELVGLLDFSKGRELKGDWVLQLKLLKTQLQ
jgi:hypothetical protein